jgi:DNA-binding SARP family transcriptional activator/Flp pilus assembly protein TadD
MSFSLKLFGGIALAGETGPLTGPPVQRHRLALLALLAATHPRAVSRDKLMAALWSERESEPARRLLNQAVHAVRQALGSEAILSSGEELQLNTGLICCDLVAFEGALARGDLGRAVALYTGPFIDGFFLDDAPEFERWVDRERDRLATAYAKAVEGLAEAAERAGDTGAAVEWWKTRAGQDPYDSRVALRLMQALDGFGNRAGALQHAVMHQQLLRDELEIEPPPEVRALVERLRQEQAHPVAHMKEGAPHRAVPRPAAVAALPATRGSDPRVFEERPQRRRTFWYATAVMLAAAPLGGAILLATRSSDTRAVATPKVVDDIAQAVARELDRRERGDTVRRLPQHRTRSIPAYELYLRGNDPALTRSDSGARLGLEYFRRAVALDTTYAAAWAGLGRMTMRTGEWAQAEAALGKALALDNSLAEAHALLGILRGWDNDFATGEHYFRRAILLEPTNGRIREWFASFLVQAGRPVEALAEAERALALDPRSPSAVAEVARALAANDRCDEAMARLEAIAALDPPLLRVGPIAAKCYGWKGK